MGLRAGVYRGPLSAYGDWVVGEWWGDGALKALDDHAETTPMIARGLGYMLLRNNLTPEGISISGVVHRPARLVLPRDRTAHR